MKNNIYQFITYALAFAVFFLIIKNCESQKNQDLLSEALTQADLKNQKFESIINSQNEQISSQKQVILSKEQAVKNNLLTIKELKKYKNQKAKIEFKTKTKIETLRVPFKDTIKAEPFVKPFSYTEKNNWYSISGDVRNTGLKFDSISFRNKYSLLIANKKLSFFKPSEPEVVLTNFNPYTSTTAMNNVVIKTETPFYNQNWLWYVLGFISKYFLNNLF